MPRRSGDPRQVALPYFISSTLHWSPATEPRVTSLKVHSHRAIAGSSARCGLESPPHTWRNRTVLPTVALTWHLDATHCETLAEESPGNAMGNSRWDCLSSHYARFRTSYSVFLPLRPLSDRSPIRSTLNRSTSFIWASVSVPIRIWSGSAIWQIRDARFTAYPRTV